VAQLHDPRAIDRSLHPQRVIHSMRALGRHGLPETFAIAGKNYRLHRSVKHDFLAATGFYTDDGGKLVVLKMGRVIDYAGFPMLWLGKWLCRRESHFYQKLQDLPNVPRFIGFVGKTGFVHEYIEGQPLSKERPIPDGFFDELQRLLKEIHCRDMAYVDTNKPQNILQGNDGRPYLIDFQISCDLQTLLDWPPGRWLLRRFQAEDLYHILKHKRRLRPDELTKREEEQSQRLSMLIRLHRFVTKPYFRFRRRTFSRLRETGRLLPEGSK